MLGEFDKPRTLVAGDKFKGGGLVTFSVITDTVVSDTEGVVVGNYTTGESYQGIMPSGVFVVTSGSIKLWK